MSAIEFQQPFFAFAFLILPILFMIKKNYKKQENAFVIPIASTYSKGKSKKQYFLTTIKIIQITTLMLTVIALMQPVVTNIEQVEKYEGIDIVLAMDCSNSMLATDIKPNRIEVAKKQAVEFINKRKHDNIGITIFAGESITIAPLTINYHYLIEKIKNIKTGTLADGTAIGVGIATALLRLSETETKSKIIVLLTDGVNNCGNIMPEDAINTAKLMGVKIYTIAIGKDNNAKIQYSQTEIYEAKGIFNENLLKNIAQETKAKFFKATNQHELNNIYNEINKLEVAPFTVTNVQNNFNLTQYIIILIMILVAAEILIKTTVLKYI